MPAYISLFAGSSWKQLAQQWVSAQGDPEKLQAAINNVLGEPWRTTSVVRSIDIDSFENRRPVPFEAHVPAWVKFLTAYVDVQDGWSDETLQLRPRFEIQVVGWGPGYEAAMIGHFVLQDHDIFSPQSLQQLDEVVFRRWTRADGDSLRIAVCGIDASHRQTEVLALCRAEHRQGIVFPMKGESETAREKAPIIANAPNVSGNRNVLVKVGTRRAKDFADRMLRNESPGAYHLHIPSSIGPAVDSDDGRQKFYESLFAEKAVTKNGVETWVRKSGAKNATGEVWDCLVGNIASIELAILIYKRTIGPV